MASRSGITRTGARKLAKMLQEQGRPEDAQRIMAKALSRPLSRVSAERMLTAFVRGGMRETVVGVDPATFEDAGDLSELRRAIGRDRLTRTERLRGHLLMDALSQREREAVELHTRQDGTIVLRRKLPPVHRVEVKGGRLVCRTVPRQ